MTITNVNISIESTKNEKNLLEIFKTDSLPIRQRIIAGKYWLKLQSDENKSMNL